MRFLTKEQVHQWCAKGGIDVRYLDGSGNASSEDHRVRFAFPKPAYRLAWLARWLVTTLPGTADRLHWVSRWGIWPSSENWTMYRFLRHGAGDDRELEAAPGLLASADEIDQLASFIQLAMMFGWDCHLWSAKNEAHAFISHDEWVRVGSWDQGLIQQATRELSVGEIVLLSDQTA